MIFGRPTSPSYSLRSMNNAAILAIGSEMLGPTRVDTNSLKITVVLEDYGIELVRKSIVGDRLGDVVSAIEFALIHADMLIITGGLGPAAADLPRGGLAAAVGLPMGGDPDLIAPREARV